MNRNGSRSGPPPRPLGPRAFLLQPGVVAAAAALAIGIGFVLRSRTDGFSTRDLFVAVMIGTAVVAGVVGTALDGSERPIVRARAVLLAWMSGALIGVGSLSLSSFGLPLLLAGFVAVPGWLSTFEHHAGRRDVVAVAAALLAGMGAVVVGVVLTR